LVLSNVLRKKLLLLQKAYIFVNLYLLLRVVNEVISNLLNKLAQLLVYECSQLVMVITLCVIFRAQDSIEIKVISLPDGQLRLVEGSASTQRIEKVERDIEVVNLPLCRV
jgi:hypothetical protein